MSVYACGRVSVYGLFFIPAQLSTHSWYAPPIVRYSQVAVGGTHTLALTDAGRLFVWGRGSFGRLGLGAGAKDHYLPVEVPLPGGCERWKVAAVAAGTSDWCSA